MREIEQYPFDDPNRPVNGKIVFIPQPTDTSPETVGYASQMQVAGEVAPPPLNRELATQQGYPEEGYYSSQNGYEEFGNFTLPERKRRRWPAAAVALLSPAAVAGGFYIGTLDKSGVPEKPSYGKATPTSPDKSGINPTEPVIIPPSTPDQDPTSIPIVPIETPTVTQEVTVTEDAQITPREVETQTRQSETSSGNTTQETEEPTSHEPTSENTRDRSPVEDESPTKTEEEPEPTSSSTNNEPQPTSTSPSTSETNDDRVPAPDQNNPSASSTESRSLENAQKNNRPTSTESQSERPSGQQSSNEETNNTTTPPSENESSEPEDRSWFDELPLPWRDNDELPPSEQESSAPAEHVNQPSQNQSESQPAEPTEASQEASPSEAQSSQQTQEPSPDQPVDNGNSQDNSEQNPSEEDGPWWKIW